MNGPTGFVLELDGESGLAPALARAARHDFDLTLAHGQRRARPGGARLACRRDDTTVAVAVLEPDESLAVAIASDALRHIMRSWPCAGPSSATVLAPAGGVCGPADTGPVDAIVVRNRWILEHAGAQYPVRLLTVQHTRCWLVSYSCEQAREGCTGPQGPGLERVPSWVASDTARVCEYAQDRGLGDLWRGLLLLGPPQFGPGRRAEALFAFTEADYACRLIGSLLAGAKA